MIALMQSSEVRNCCNRGPWHAAGLPRQPSQARLTRVRIAGCQPTVATRRVFGGAAIPLAVAGTACNLKPLRSRRAASPHISPQSVRCSARTAPYQHAKPRPPPPIFAKGRRATRPRKWRSRRHLVVGTRDIFADRNSPPPENFSDVCQNIQPPAFAVRCKPSASHRRSQTRARLQRPET